MRSDADRLSDVLEAITRIEKYSAQVGNSELADTWVIHHLEIVGEACRNISAQFRESHPEIPWQAIVGMRNALSHQYFGIDIALVREAVTRDLPELRDKIRSALGI